MTVVAPLSAVVGAVSPVVVGLVDGERPEPVAYVGIVLAVGAVALVSGATVSASIARHRRRSSASPCSPARGSGCCSSLRRYSILDSGLWPLVGVRAAGADPARHLLRDPGEARPASRSAAAGGPRWVRHACQPHLSQRCAAGCCRWWPRACCTRPAPCCSCSRSILLVEPRQGVGTGVAVAAPSSSPRRG